MHRKFSIPPTLQSCNRCSFTPEARLRIFIDSGVHCSTGNNETVLGNRYAVNHYCVKGCYHVTSHDKGEDVARLEDL